MGGMGKVAQPLFLFGKEGKLPLPLVAGWSD